MAEENDMFEQQKDLFLGYKLKYKEWHKVPKNKIAPSFKLLKVDEEDGIKGILRKLGIDPSPITDENDNDDNNE